MRFALFAAGVATLVAWWLPWEAGGWNHALLLEPPHGPFGLSFEWVDRLGEVTVTLGVVAILAAVFLTRAFAALATVVLALGAAYLLAWLIDPLPGSEPRWPAYMAVIAPAIGAIAAAWLTRRGGALAGRRRARGRRVRPRPHSPMTPR